MQAQVADGCREGASRDGCSRPPASARAASRLVDPRAYEFYLRGRQAARGSPSARRRRAATSERSRPTPASAKRSRASPKRCICRPASGGAPDDAARRERVQAAAKRAYELDPDLPAANVAMALTSDSLAETLKYFHHAIELDPVVRRRLSPGRRRSCRTSIRRRRSRSSGSRWRSIRRWMPAVRRHGARALGARCGRDDDGAERAEARCRVRVPIPQLTARRRRRWPTSTADVTRTAAAADAPRRAAGHPARRRSDLAALAVDRKDDAPAAHRARSTRLLGARRSWTARVDVRRSGARCMRAAAMRNGAQAAALLDRIAAERAGLRALCAPSSTAGRADVDRSARSIRGR